MRTQWLHCKMEDGTIKSIPLTSLMGGTVTDVAVTRHKDHCDIAPTLPDLEWRRDMDAAVAFADAALVQSERTDYIDVKVLYHHFTLWAKSHGFTPTPSQRQLVAVIQTKYNVAVTRDMILGVASDYVTTGHIL